MRRTRINAGFFFSLIINMLLNIEGLIVSGILIALHYILRISIWWGIGAFALWIAYLIIWMLVLGFAADCSSEPQKKQENKNPYSKGPYKSIKDNTNDK